MSTVLHSDNIMLHSDNITLHSDNIMLQLQVPTPCVMLSLIDVKFMQCYSVLQM